MPADPNVYAQIKPTPILTPQQYELQRNQDQLTLADQQTKLQGVRDQAIARSVFARLGNDPEAALSELRRLAPSVVPAYEKQIAESRKSALDSVKSHLELAEKSHTQGMQWAQYARDLRDVSPDAAASAWNHARRLLAEDDDDLQAFPEQVPDDQTFDAIARMGMTREQQLKEHAAAQDAYVKGDLLGGFAKHLLAAGDDPDALTEAVESARVIGVPKATVQAVANMTPEQRGQWVQQQLGGKTETQFTLTPGSKRFDASGKVIAEVPASEGTQGGFTLAPGGRRYDAQGNLIATAPDRPGGGAAGPKPRGVTSGDANRIAEINTAIGEAANLRGEIGSVAGATGTAAEVGAMLPNFVTNITGWGKTAKEKQAVIDRVKQIIGKGLEGGVLRKEDEYKYAKILPTIGDNADLVKSKLDGLDAALARKREEQLSSLEDAGYDTSRYRAREQGGGKGTPKKVGRFTVEVED